LDEQTARAVAKPSDHPQFFLMPPPQGRSRESTIRLDRAGRFLHDGEPVEHEGVSRAMHTWIARHPIDGRFILVNGYDWTYFAVDDVPFFVESVRGPREEPELELSDGSVEPWRADDLYEGDDAALYTWVKHASAGGPFLAKFAPRAQLGLERFLEERDGEAVVVVRGHALPLGRRAEVEAQRPLGKS
jgi:hypothetical protein